MITQQFVSFFMYAFGFLILAIGILIIALLIKRLLR